MKTTILCGIFLLSVAVSIPLFADDPRSPLTVAPDDGTVTSTYGPFVYDPSGNIAAIGSTPGSYYVYDPMSRVVTAAVQRGTAVQTQTYSYDAYGNRLSVGGSGGATYTVSVTSNRLTSQSAVYDPAGNLLRWYPVGSPSPREYTYDATSMLIHEDTGADLPSVMHIYTAEDERYWSIETIAGTPTRNVSRYALRDLNGKVLRKIIEDSSFSAEDYVYRDGLLLAAIKSSATHHYSLDHLGTPRVVTDQNGAPLAEHTYYPFGQEITDNSPTDGFLKFTGHERDSDLLNVVNGRSDYMHARYYNASIGRFLSADSSWRNEDVGAPQSWNRYAYALNNPVDKIDPNGKWTISVSVGGFAAFGAATSQKISFNFDGRGNYSVTMPTAVGGGTPVVETTASVALNWRADTVDDLVSESVRDSDLNFVAGGAMIVASNLELGVSPEGPESIELAGGVGGALFGGVDVHAVFEYTPEPSTTGNVYDDIESFFGSVTYLLDLTESDSLGETQEPDNDEWSRLEQFFSWF